MEKQTLLLTCVPLLLFIPPLFHLFLFFFPLISSTALCVIALLSFHSSKKSLVSHDQLLFHFCNDDIGEMKEVEVTEMQEFMNISESKCDENCNEAQYCSCPSTYTADICEDIGSEEVKEEFRTEEVDDEDKKMNATSVTIFSLSMQRLRCRACGLQEDNYCSEKVQASCFNPWHSSICV